MRTLRIAGIAAAGLLGLAGCGSLQGAAVFVGDERVSEATVDAYVDEAADSSVEQGMALGDFDYRGGREQIMLLMVLAELGEEIGLAEPDTSAAESDLHEMALRAEGYYQQLISEAEPRELTDEEIAALDEMGLSFAQMPARDQGALMQLAGTSDLFAGYVEEYDVRVNPRYGFDAIPLGAEQLQGLFDVEIPQR